MVRKFILFLLNSLVTILEIADRIAYVKDVMPLRHDLTSLHFGRHRPLTYGIHNAQEIGH